MGFFFYCQFLNDVHWGKSRQCLHGKEGLTHVACLIFAPTLLVLACHCGGQGFIPEQCMGDFWYTEWHLDRFSIVYLVLSCQSLVSCHVQSTLLS
jgi:hypothetical protein